jgi:DNA-binding PadR family transcriptional regulator
MVHPKSFDLTGFQRDLLYVIAGSDQPSGQIVRQKLESHIENVNHGRLYPNLDELVDHGLVEKGSQDNRTNYYEVTSRGEQLLVRRREWEDQYIAFSDDSDKQESGQLSLASSSSD